MDEIAMGLCLGHNPSVAIARNGELEFAIEQEKVSGVKNQLFFVKDAIRCGLAGCGLSPKDVKRIAIHADPETHHGLRGGDLPLRFEAVPFAYLSFLRHVANKKIWLRHLGLDPGATVSFHGHHKSHAAEAFLQSGLENAAILVVDGRGESESTTFWKGDGSGLHLLHSIPPSESIGYLYLMFTSFMGFRYGDEYKVMGLASYGKPLLKEKILEVFNSRERRKALMRDGYITELSLHAFRVRKDIGKPPKNSEFSNFAEKWPMGFTEKADLAASLQAATEEIVLGYAKRLLEMAGEKNLCISGGVAQNSVLNGKLVSESGFEKIFVSSCPNDGGTAAGAAMLACGRKAGKREGAPSPFLGPKIDVERTLALLEKAGFSYRKAGEPEKEVAKLLNEGEAVGLARGRAEFGPRALGHRSIIANPSDAGIKDRLNTIKGRELFRPLAPSVKAECAEEYFVTKGAKSPYMSFVFEAREKARSLAPAIVHVDGSSRVQTVEREFEPGYWKLLDCFERLSGFCIVLNTSLNLAGFPLAATGEEVVRTMKNSQLRHLLLEDYMVER